MVDASVYLYNKTPRQAQEWKSLFKAFHKKKPQLAHLKAYECKAYAMTENAQIRRNRKQKLEPKAYVGYLVGYRSINIFKIWISDRRTVISTRDVIFDEISLYDEQTSEKETFEEVIQRVKLSISEALNEGIFEEDEDIFDHISIEDEDEYMNVESVNKDEDLKLAEQAEQMLLSIHS